MCMKDMISGSKDMVLERSIDMKMAIAKKGESDNPIKSFCVHKKCSTPLWKIALIMLGIVGGMLLVCKMMKHKKCRDCEE